MDRWVRVVHRADLMARTVHQGVPGDRMAQVADRMAQVADRMDQVADRMDHMPHRAEATGHTDQADQVVDRMVRRVAAEWGTPAFHTRGSFIKNPSA